MAQGIPQSYFKTTLTNEDTADQRKTNEFYPLSRNFMKTQVTRSQEITRSRGSPLPGLAPADEVEYVTPQIDHQDLYPNAEKLESEIIHQGRTIVPPFFFFSQTQSSLKVSMKKEPLKISSKKHLEPKEIKEVVQHMIG